MKKLKAFEGSPISQVVQPGRANFAMIEKVALHTWTSSCKRTCRPPVW